MENSLVIKHNDLIEARYDLNLLEQKIILYSVTKIDMDNKKFNLISLEIKEITEMIGTENDRYNEFRKIANGLMDKRVYLKDRPNLEVRWLSSCEYIGNGIIELEFSEKLVPYLLQLKARFTRYQIKNIIYLKNKHSLRIYELLKQYETIGKREFTVEDLKRTLFIEGQYERFYDFKKHVIDKTQEEINEHTDIFIKYEELRTGRQVTRIRYTISSYNKESFYDIPELKYKMGLNNEKFSNKQISNIYELAVSKVNDKFDVYEYVRLNYLHIKDKARNTYGYLISSIENDYAVAAGQLKMDYYIKEEK